MYGRIRVLGETVWEQSRGRLMVVRGASFSKNKSIDVGPVSVSVRGKANAVAGVMINGGAGQDYVALFGEPFINVGGSASASLGGLCASAGVEGSLNLLYVGLPLVLTLDLEERTWEADVGTSYDLPEGDVSVFVNICGAKYSESIVDFDFGGGHLDLFEQSGQF